jgi:hypothetical protein
MVVADVVISTAGFMVMVRTSNMTCREYHEGFLKLILPMFDSLKTPLKLAVLVGVAFSVQACAVIAVADAAVTVVATGVKITAKGVGAVAGALLPGDDKKE